MRESFKIFIVILSFSLSNGQDKLTVNDAVKLALENNLDIKISENQNEILKNNASFLNSGYLPRVSSRVGFNKSNQNIEIETPNNLSGKLDNMKSENSFSNVSIEYILFDNNGRKFNYKKSKELSNRSGLEVKEVIENTLLQLYTVFYEVCRLSEEKDIVKSSLEISKSRLERNKIKFDFGQSTKLELLNAEVDVNTDSIRYLNAVKNLSNAKRDLNLVMNVDLNSDYILDKEIVYNSAENIINFYDNASKNNTKLKIYAKSVEISDFELKSIRSTYLPTVGLNGSYDWNESINDNPYAFFNKNIYDGISGGINLRWDIFNQGKRITANKNAKVMLENSKIEKEKAFLIFQKELNNSYETYNNNLFILEVQEQSLNTSNNNFLRNLEKYDIGIVSSIEFRNAQLNLLNAKLSRNTARYEAKLSELYFLKISGKIIDASF
mgnify:FL=1|tara:strand:+ start:3484 stop:4800 length:1317 start_codon:yes stop_codon:yes gene_type:complete